MGYQANYSSRHFSRGTKALAFARTKDAAGVPRCRCTAILTTGHIHYDHIIPWAISRHSGPRNCQVLCDACHQDKTSDIDVPLIASNDRVRDRHIGAFKAKHPMPCGRGSRWSKPIGGRAPVRRLTQGQKLAAALAHRRLEPNPAEV